MSNIRKLHKDNQAKSETPVCHNLMTFKRILFIVLRGTYFAGFDSQYSFTHMISGPRMVLSVKCV